MRKWKEGAATRNPHTKSPTALYLLIVLACAGMGYLLSLGG